MQSLSLSLSLSPGEIRADQSCSMFSFTGTELNSVELPSRNFQTVSILPDICRDVSISGRQTPRDYFVITTVSFQILSNSDYPT
jgi:hypothetical protein